MAVSFNKVIVAGNLTRDPDLKHLPSGSAVCDLGLAINERYTGKDGQSVDNTVFVDIVAWNKQAEICSEYLSKGESVMIEGALQLDKWQTKDGDNRSKMRIRAHRVVFLGGDRIAAKNDGENVPTTDTTQIVDAQHDTRDSGGNLPF